MARRTKARISLLLPFLLSVALAACSGGETTEVDVFEAEWRIDPAVIDLAPGKVKFVVANQGSRPHELLVLKSDLPPNSLPMFDAKVDESKVKVVDRIKPFGAGETRELSLELSSGKYLLVCNIVERPSGKPIESHYDEGMVAVLTALK